MLGIQNALRHYRYEIAQQSTQLNHDVNRATLMPLLDEAAASATHTVPEKLFNRPVRRGVVEVDADTLALLKTANAIGWLARALIDGAGNQTLDVLRSPANAKLVAHLRVHIRDARLRTFDAGALNEEAAINAVGIGKGNCGEYADLVLELARILNIPARKVVDCERDHVFVVLGHPYPHPPDKSVVVDAWPAVVTTCLATEYDRFHRSGPFSQMVASHDKDGAPATYFNLEAILASRRRFIQGFGKNGMEDAVTEHVRHTYCITNAVLHQHARLQGVSAYTSIDLAAVPETERPIVEKELSRFRKQIEKKLLKELATPSASGRDLLWNEIYTGSTISTYKLAGCPDDPGISFDRAPAEAIRQIETQMRRAKRKNFPRAYRPDASSLTKALRGNFPKRWVEKSRDAIQLAMGRRARPPIWDAAYESEIAQPVIDRVGDAMKALHDRRTGVASDAGAGQLEAIGEVECRLASLPRPERDAALLGLVSELPDLDPAAQAEAARIIHTWAESLSGSHYGRAVAHCSSLWLSRFDSPLENQLRPIVLHYIWTRSLRSLIWSSMSWQRRKLKPRRRKSCSSSWTT